MQAFAKSGGPCEPTLQLPSNSVCAQNRVTQKTSWRERPGIATPFFLYRASRFRPSDDFPLGGNLKGCSTPKAPINIIIIIGLPVIAVIAVFPITVNISVTNVNIVTISSNPHPQSKHNLSPPPPPLLPRLRLFITVFVPILLILPIKQKTRLARRSSEEPVAAEAIAKTGPDQWSMCGFDEAATM